MKQRKVPLRKCIATQEMLPKRELIRIVRTPAGEVQLDLTGKKPGRGAYIRGAVSSFQLARKTKALDRALKQAVSDEIYAQLEQDFIAIEQQFEAARELVQHDRA